MNDRRAFKYLRVAKIAQGYLQFVDPEAEGEFWYMHGEEFDTPYCLVEFR